MHEEVSQWQLGNDYDPLTMSDRQGAWSIGFVLALIVAGIAIWCLGDGEDYRDASYKGEGTD